MFKNIYFRNYMESIQADDLRNNPQYREIRKDLDMADLYAEQFQLDGCAKYILGHPMTQERSRTLIHMQSFGYMESGPKYYTDRTSYTSLLVLYTYDGHGQLNYEGKDYDLFEGDGFIIDCQKPHVYKTIGNRWTHSDLHVYGGSASLMYQELFACENPIFHTPNRDTYQNQLEEVLRNDWDSTIKRDYLMSNSIEKLLLLIHDLLVTSTSRLMPENLRLLQQYMEMHFQEKLHIDDLAAFANISKYHLIRQFSACTGFTPHEYLIHLRLQYAESLLLGTDLPSYRIGILSGFSTESNFVEKFKKHFGMTPGEYRRKTKH